MNEKMREALWNIRGALLLFVLNINILGFDILPDFVGWMLMLSAITLLEPVVQSIGRLRSFGRILLADALAEVVLNYIPGSGWLWNTLIPFVNVLILCIHIYFMYVMLTAAAEAAGQAGGEAETVKKLCRSRNLVSVAELLTNLSIIFTVMANRTWLLVLCGGLYFIFYIGCMLQLTFLMEEIGKKEEMEKTARLES